MDKLIQKHMKINYRMTVSLLFLIFMFSNVEAQKPDRAILFLIDGLHWKAPGSLNMPVFNSLVREGVYVQKSYVIIPHHPTVGDYGKFNTSSFPNPMIQSGTIFIKPENRMIQEMISPQHQTAFLANDVAYRTIARGSTTCILDTTLSDDQIIEMAIDILEEQDPRFMRIHLQTPGNMGFLVSNSSPEKEYYRNIFGKGSPYISSVEHADKLLGRMISYLKGSGKWDKTILMVSSDHGQSIVGWHPPFEEDGWIVPLVVTGPGIAGNRRLPYFEITDIAPTIAWLLGVQLPNVNGGEGRAVKEIMENVNAENYMPVTYIKTINQQIKEYNYLKAKLLIGADKMSYNLNIYAALENEDLTPEPFYHQDRITDWYKAGSKEHLIEANEKILKLLRNEPGIK
jgi:hypothetical protein